MPDQRPTDSRISPRLQLHVNQAQDSQAPEDPVQAIIASTGGLAALPQVVCQVIEAADGDEGNVRKLEQTISVDPGLSSRLLTQANSAYFALPTKVTSIREAIMFLGFKGVRDIAMAVGVFDAFLGKTDKESMRRRAWWRQSLDAAIGARAMADFVPQVNADEAYTCGLLHLIGKTVLDRHNPAEYERVQAVVDQGAPDVLAERAVFECDHIAVALAAARAWGFPQILVQGLDYFTPARDPKPEDELRAMTALASKLIRLVETGRSPADIGLEQIPTWIVETLRLTDNHARALVRTAVDAIEAGSCMSL